MHCCLKSVPKLFMKNLLTDLSPLLITPSSPLSFPSFVIAAVVDSTM